MKISVAQSIFFRFFDDLSPSEQQKYQVEQIKKQEERRAALAEQSSSSELLDAPQRAAGQLFNQEAAAAAGQVQSAGTNDRILHQTNTQLLRLVQREYLL